MDWTDRFAFVFNRTALGVGVLLIGWAVLQGHWFRAGIMLFVVLPLYFYLHRRLDAP